MAAGTTLSATAAAGKTNRIRATPGKVATGLANTANRTDATLECLTDCAAEHTKERHCFYFRCTKFLLNIWQLSHVKPHGHRKPIEFGRTNNCVSTHILDLQIIAYAELG